MFEEFTDCARKAMALANQEAVRLNHAYIGTEHILLGLVKEASGTGGAALRKLGITLQKVLIEVERLVKAGPETVANVKLPSQPRAKKVIEYAIEEARKLGDDYVGTEHLLLGLLRETDGVAAQVLLNLGLNLQTNRVEVMKLLAESAGPEGFTGIRSLSSPAIAVLKHAVEECRNLGHSFVRPEHILLGLLRDDGHLASQILMRYGLNVDELRAEIIKSK